MLSHGTDIAAHEAVCKGMALASDALEASEADIEYAAGADRIAGTDRQVTLLELARPAEGQGSGPLDTPASAQRAWRALQASVPSASG